MADEKKSDEHLSVADEHIENGELSIFDLLNKEDEQEIKSICNAIESGRVDKIYYFLSYSLTSSNEKSEPWYRNLAALSQAIISGSNKFDSINLPFAGAHASSNALSKRVFDNIIPVYASANIRKIEVPNAYVRWTGRTQLFDNMSLPDLYESLSKNDNIEAYDFSNAGRLDGKKVQELLQQALAVDGAYDIDLSMSSFSANAHFVFQQLARMNNVKSLNLSEMDLTDAHAKHLATLISKSPTFKAINLTDCKMSGKAWAAISEALDGNPHLQVTGHKDETYNSLSMPFTRDELITFSNDIAEKKPDDLSNELIGYFFTYSNLFEKVMAGSTSIALNQELSIEEQTDRIQGILTQARLRGIEIPEAVREKHRDKLMGSSLMAPKGHQMQVGVLETMLRADKSIDMEVGLHDSLVASISEGIEAIIATEKGTTEAHEDAKFRLKQAKRDAEHMNRKIDGMVTVEGARGRAAASKRAALDEADARLSSRTAMKEQIARVVIKSVWEGGKAASKAYVGMPVSLNDFEGVGNALGDVVAGYYGEKMRIRDRRVMRGIEADIEASCRAEIIDILEAQRIDVEPYRKEVNRLAKEMKKLAESKQIEEIRQDEAKQERIASGLLRQRLVKSGLDVCVELEKYHLMPNDIESIDSFLSAFKDERLHEAVENLCYGRANSNDMEVMIAEANSFTGDKLKPHQKALKSFVEDYIKQDIDGFMTKASFVDAIGEYNLINLDTLGFSGEVDKEAPETNSKGELVVSENDKDSRKSRIALMSAFAEEYGQRHIGNYYIQRLFRFWLTRHGDTTLVADEVLDGNEIVYNDLVGKEVNIQPERDMRRFTEAVKRGGSIRQGNMPMPDDLFLRVCAYEYYLPQAVKTSNVNNKLSDNPEAPIAYPMVNEVVTKFVKNMVDGGLEDYQSKIGPRLDNVMAQSFIDFFAKMGRQHRVQFSSERENLRTGYGQDLYTRKFMPHKKLITESALAEYDLFLSTYADNLEKYMQVVPEDERAELEEQVGAVKELADGKLNPPIIKPGSHADKERARQDDHTLANITEDLGRGGKRA